MNCTRYVSWLLLLFAFLAPLSKAIGNILLCFLILYWLCTLPQFLAKHNKDPFVLTTGAFIVALAANIPWGWIQTPVLDPGAEGPAVVAFSMLRIPLAVLAVGWALERTSLNSLTLLQTFLAGIGLTIIYPILLGWVPVLKILSGNLRTGLGFSGTLNTLGLFSGTALVITLALLPSSMSKKDKRRLSWAFAFWTALGLIALFGLFASQTRSAWFGAIAGMVMLVITALRAHKVVLSNILAFRRQIFVIIVFLTIISSMTAAWWPHIENRIGSSLEPLQELVLWQPKAIGLDSGIGKRFHMWTATLPHWKNHALFGMGPAAPEYLLENYAPQGLRQFPNTHNIFIDMLLRMGIIGMLFLLGFLGYLLLPPLLWQAPTPPNIALTCGTTAGLTVFFVYSLAHSTLTANQSLFLVGILAGLVFANRASQIHCEAKRSWQAS